jgi:large subunit ribosomal protein L25
MATKDFKLAVEQRTRLGTTGAQSLRAVGKVPAVLYGHGVSPEHLALDARAFEDLLHHAGRNAIITLTDGPRKRQTALVREIARHPVSRRVVHADLQRVTADETIDARLAVVTIGVAEGVRNAGAVMDVITHELEIAGPANQIPEHLEIDVTPLDIHQHITAGEVPLPDGFRLLTAPETIVVSIEPSKTARDLEEAAAPAEEVAEPEVIGAQPEAAAPEEQ